MTDPATPPSTTVLLADDHPAMRDGLRLRLGLDPTIRVVAEASDGAQALELIRSHTPDIALVDLRMPGLDGMALVAAVREANVPTRMVLVSALTEGHLVQRALDVGAYGYVGKDSPMDVIVDAIHSVSRGARYIDPTLLAVVLEPGGDRLTEREREVLQLAADGKQNKVIAQTLGLSEETIKSHLSNVMRKLGAQSRTEAVAAALRRSLIT